MAMADATPAVSNSTAAQASGWRQSLRSMRSSKWNARGRDCAASTPTVMPSHWRSRYIVSSLIQTRWMRFILIPPCAVHAADLRPGQSGRLARMLAGLCEGFCSVPHGSEDLVALWHTFWPPPETRQPPHR